MLERPAAAMRRCPSAAHPCTKASVGEPSRVRALTREVASLRAEIEEYRAELRHVLDRFLDESACGSTQDRSGGRDCVIGGGLGADHGGT